MHHRKDKQLYNMCKLYILSVLLQHYQRYFAHHGAMSFLKMSGFFIILLNIHHGNVSFILTLFIEFHFLPPSHGLYLHTSPLYTQSYLFFHK